MSSTANRGYRVAPRSAKSIEEVAKNTRELLAAHNLINTEGKVNVIGVLESLLPKGGYRYYISDVASMGNHEAFVIPDNGLLALREDVYEKLLCDDGRARFTIMHELGHIILQHNATFHRNGDGKHKPFEDSEWQANTFSSYVLIPADLCLQYARDEYDIMERFGVSYQAAEIALSKIKKATLE